MRFNKSLFGVLALLVVAQGLLQGGFLLPRWTKNYGVGNGVVANKLDSSQILFQLLGFREFLAGILWVKADSFFDNGNYDAILPLIRLCTILDPHQIDIYAVGMWHVGYNFTDEEQRSDRRYIPAALALGAEGAAKNPDTYEMYFENGWMWLHKIDDDYDQAVRWMEEASTKKDIIPARRDILAKAYERDGKIDDQLNLYYQLLDKADEDFERQGKLANFQIRDTIEQNLNNTIVRMVQRGYLAKERKDGSYESGDYDTKPPFDVGLSAKITVTDPKVIRVEGTWNVLPVGTHLRLILRDLDYPKAVPAGMEWYQGSGEVNLDPPKGISFMQDQLFVKNRRFNRRVDMSKDPTMYPFLKPEYLVEIYYNPRSAPAHLQDKFGFSGEGMTDKNYLNTEIRPGQRVIYATLKLTRDQLLRQNEWRDKVPVIKTPNYKETDATGSADDLITVPSFRSGG